MALTLASFPAAAPPTPITAAPPAAPPASLSSVPPWGATLAKCPTCVLPALPRPPRRAAYWAGPDAASSLRLPGARPLHGSLRGPASELLGVWSAPCPSGLGSRAVRAQSGLPPAVPARAAGLCCQFWKVLTFSPLGSCFWNPNDVGPHGLALPPGPGHSALCLLPLSSLCILLGWFLLTSSCSRTGPLRGWACRQARLNNCSRTGDGVLFWHFHFVLLCNFRVCPVCVSLSHWILTPTSAILRPALDPH